MKSLYFFTDTYPLGGLTESSFITPETSAINESFDSVTILPENKILEGEHVEYPKKFHIDSSLCDLDKTCSNVRLLRHLLNPFVRRLLIKERKRIKNKIHFFSFLRYINRAFLYKAYIEKLLSNREIVPENTVLYSFWFSEITFALALLCDKYGLNFCCRAHGYDLYDERVIFRSHSIREFTLSKIQAVYPCSQNGQEYICKQYPAYSDKIKFSYLGSTKLFDAFNPKSEDNKTLTFFTCARLHPVKRLAMTFEILSNVSHHFSNLKIKWIIAGNGEERTNLEKLISNNKCTNFDVKLLGALSNKEIQFYYTQHHIDFGILLSESEGLPISVCEQLSYKIPVIATKVGGLPEVIDESNGIMLSSEPTSDELISKITKYIGNPEFYNIIRNNAYNTWLNNFNSLKNRNVFISKLSL